MGYPFDSRDAALVGWAAYGLRDAVVFTVGFILALVLAAPFG
jgi:hypothetical protein